MMNTPYDASGMGNGLLAPPPPMQPAPALVTLQPVQMPSQDDQQQTKVRVRSILAAFRRRWFVAICLGLIASGAAAFTVWSTVPDTYTAFAELQIDPANRLRYSASEMGESVENILAFKQTLMRLATYPFVLNRALRDQKISNLPTLKDQVDPVKWLEDTLQISSPADQFIRISLTSTRKEDVAEIVNAVVNAVQTEIVDVNRQDKDRRTLELKEHLSLEHKTLKSKRDELIKLDKRLATANTNQADLRMGAQFSIRVQLAQRLGELEWEILQKRIELELLRQEPVVDGTGDAQSTQVATSDDTLPTPEELDDSIIESLLLQDPTYQEYSKSLIWQKQAVTMWEKRVHPNHAKLRELAAGIAKTEKEQEAYREAQMPKIRDGLIARIKEEQAKAALAARQAIADGKQAPPIDPVAAAEKSLDLLQKMQASVKEEIKNTELTTNDFSAEWATREQIAEEAEKLKASVAELENLVKAREVETTYEVEHPPIKVARTAEPPKVADQGTRIKLAGVAGAGLFALVVAGIVLLEYSAHRLNSVTEVQGDLNLQVMSTIPLMPRWVNSDNGNSRNRRSEYWHSVLTESVDATRTLLLRHASVNATKAVMIASATGGEGKTTLACHLSTSLARAGRRVLLIDGDIRRPSVHKVFDLKNKPGLCEVLTDKIDLPDTLHEVSPAGLTVLTAGRVDSDALRVLAQDKFGQLLEIARNQFDFIIVDTSPILPVTDALLMSQFMDGVLFSVRRDVSRAAKVSAAVQRVSMLGVNVLGAVAIGLDEGPGHSRYSYYNYGYGQTYGYGHSPYAPGPGASAPPA